MAGIGFELRKVLRRNTLGSTVAAYTYAGVIGAGPLVLSIIGILLIGFWGLSTSGAEQAVAQFQVSVTYLIAASLVLTGSVQLAFSRYMSDRLYEDDPERILPAFNAVTLIVTLASGAFAWTMAFTIFSEQSTIYRVLMLTGFVLLSNIWLAIVFLSSIKQFRSILVVFFIAYVVTVLAAGSFRHHGVEGLLGGFVLGHLLLLAGLLALIYRRYRCTRYMTWDVVHLRVAYPGLMLVGLLFNAGVWLDKVIFWFAPTGHDVIGPLRASVIYDIPVFISYLCLIPGMAVFLLRLETDFVDHYDAYYRAIKSGGTLNMIRDRRKSMVRSARTGLYEILKIQTVVILLVFAFGDEVLELLDISTLYAPLLRIDVIAASMQILFLGVLNIFFYLDQRKTVLLLTALFVFLNGVLTWLTLVIGPDVYGYGFAVALIVVVTLGVSILDRCFRDLDYQTYMLQKA